jgi:beta-aspartyl-peptidase (threonine type)
VTHTRHPISLARAVMEKSPYVMMAGPGTDAFAASVGLEQVEPSFFFTEARWQSLVKQLQKEGKPVPPRPAGAPPEGAVVPVAFYDEGADPHSHGTTGVVALDRQGNIAAGTSTGGLQGKMPGRVGDSPIIGAGTYASNPARCLPRARASTSSASAWHARSAILSASKACRFSRPRMR